MHYLKTHTLSANVQKRQTKKAVVAVDMLRMYMYALGCQMIEKFSIFDISKLSPQKTVSTQRVKNGSIIYHEVTVNEVWSL